MLGRDKLPLDSKWQCMDNRLPQKTGTQLEGWSKLFLAVIFLSTLCHTQSFPLLGSWVSYSQSQKYEAYCLDGWKIPLFMPLIRSFSPRVKYHICKHFIHRFIWKEKLFSGDEMRSWFWFSPRMFWVSQKDTYTQWASRMGKKGIPYKLF